MRCLPKAGASLTGLCVVLAAIAGCASGPGRSQELLAVQSVLSGRYEYLGPSMINYLDPDGTFQSRITEIPADSAERITLISATLIALPGFRTPQLVSTGVIAGSCRQILVLLPPAGGHPSVVAFGGHPYQPLPLRGYTMVIGAGCVPQIIYVVRAKSTGQYAVGGLRVLVRHDGRLQTMYGNDGTDVWYYDSSWLPTARQVVNGLQGAFAAQVARYRSRR
jgi:hypothetical protein